MKRSEQKAAVAERAADMREAIPAETVREGVTLLNPGFFRMEQIRYAARPKERAELRQVLQERK